MRKFLMIISVCFLLCLSGCYSSLYQEPEKDRFKITVVNNTNQFILFNIIYGVTGTSKGQEFYSTTHNYVCNFYGDEIYKQSLAPSGTVSDDRHLDKQTIWLKQQNYNVTVFVTTNNNYTTEKAKFIGKGTFNISGPRTIQIDSNGLVY